MTHALTQPERRTCGTWEYHLRLLQTNPDYRRAFANNERFILNYLAAKGDAGFRSTVITIPVVVHIVYNTNDYDISDAVVQSQIDALNRDYRMLNADISGTPAAFAGLTADARIQFQLAARDPTCQPTTGITRTSTSVASFDIFNTDTVKATATGGIDPWPTDRYLNIWVCKGQANQLGRGTFPGTPANIDGLIIVTEAFGTTGPLLFSSFNLGRTATHEIGHYFDLHHLWGDVSDCSGTDFVADTPNQQNPNYGCPTFPHVSCSNGPNGDMFMNFMDYTDDRCMFMFTAGQAARMEAALAGPRNSLLASDGAVPPPVPDIADLWSADTLGDTGAEPDPIAADMWDSDDIWVRNQADGATNQEHQNPIYGQQNFVYIRVRNRGCSSTTSSGILKLYWAKASSGLGWPAPWDGSVSTPALMGGLIGSQSTGAVAGRGSEVLQFAWNPPNPNDYSSFGGDKNHFCLLSRIETSSTAPFGMSFPETGDLNANVRNNNNIVWKNVEVVTAGGRSGFITVGSLDKRVTQIELTLTVPTGEHPVRLGAQEWDLELELDPALMKLVLAHPNTHGAYQQTGPDRLRVLQLGAPLGPLTIVPPELHTIGVVFGPPAGTHGVFAFDLIQRELVAGRARVSGGQRLILNLTRPAGIVRLPDHLFQHWIHAHEEDSPDVEVFRPASTNLPPSRGRRALELRADHSLVQYDIAATDGHVRHEGYWYAESPERIVVRFDEARPAGYAFDIVSHASDVLRMGRRSSA
jgi:hypothetical protein